IHCDVKSSNILLGENFKAKVADFGLSKPRINDKDSFTTYLKGSFGYIDPEHIRTQRITNKSDVYSFMVVLFEVLCAIPINDHELSEDMINLTQWALEWQKKGQLMNIIDHSLQGNINPESLRVYGEIAEFVANRAAERPSMHTVLSNMEYALKLQEAPEEQSMNVVHDISKQATTSAHYGATIKEDLPSGSMCKVFSKILVSDDEYDWKLHFANICIMMFHFCLSVSEFFSILCDLLKVKDSGFSRLFKRAFPRGL
ncbi:Receptor-like protein kinase HERK 1, partial [Bienertia sinuspersici]